MDFQPPPNHDQSPTVQYAAEHAPHHYAHWYLPELIADSQSSINQSLEKTASKNYDSATTTLRNLGQTFRQVELPRGWTVKEDQAWRRGGGYRWFAKHPKSADLEISISRRTNTLQPSESQNLDSLLADRSKLLYDTSWQNKPEYKQDHARQQALQAQVSQLSSTLGRSQLGDNQFTNSDPAAATFHIDRLETKLVNGKHALAISGHFPIDGKPARYLTGVIIPQKVGNDTDVHRIIMQSTEKLPFVANISNFNKTLQSIVWE